MGFLLGLFAIGCALGFCIGWFVPLRGSPRGLPGGVLKPIGAVMVVVSIVVGAVLGLFVPVFALALFGVGSGSYEDTLFLWPITVPATPIVAGLITLRLFKRLY